MNSEETQSRGCWVTPDTAWAPWKSSFIWLPPNCRTVPDLDWHKPAEMAATSRRFWTLESSGVPPGMIRHTQKEVPSEVTKKCLQLFITLFICLDTILFRKTEMKWHFMQLGFNWLERMYKNKWWKKCKCKFSTSFTAHFGSWTFQIRLAKERK